MCAASIAVVILASSAGIRKVQCECRSAHTLPLPVRYPLVNTAGTAGAVERRDFELEAFVLSRFSVLWDCELAGVPA